MQRPFRASSLYDTSKNNPFNQKVFARYLTQIQTVFNLAHPSQAVKGCCTICWNRATAGVPDPPFGGAGARRIVFRASPNMNRRRRSPRLWRGAQAPGIYLRAFCGGFGIFWFPKGIAMPIFPMASCGGVCVRVSGRTAIALSSYAHAVPLWLQHGGAEHAFALGIRSDVWRSHALAFSILI